MCNGREVSGSSGISSRSDPETLELEDELAWRLKTDGSSSDGRVRLSSIDAGSESEGDVTVGESVDEGCGVVAVNGSLFETSFDGSRDRRVGRLGVDFDWNPGGTGPPRLCGAMTRPKGGVRSHRRQRSRVPGRES